MAININTKELLELLEKLNIPVVTYWNAVDLIEDEHPLYCGRAGNMGDRPGNWAIQNADLILAVGSGVIQDLCKYVSFFAHVPYMVVATAPSMDGYASASSSMTRDGLKISLPSRSADVIIGDTQILKTAPMHMLRSGLGDMLAKFISIAEWRIAHIITGEYYCEEVAKLIRSAVKKCVDNAEGLLAREDAAIEAVFEGLVIGGVAMNYAGVSRPASGVEHYFSHIWDMRALAFNTPMDFHGIQCAVGCG